MRLPRWLPIGARVAGFIGTSAGALLLAAAVSDMPPGDNPIVPLSLAHEPGAATPLKLAHMRASPAECRAVLVRSGMTAEMLPDRRESDMCAMTNAVTVDRSETDYSAPVAVACPLAASLYLWERNVLQPLAEEHLGQPVARIDHYGAYSCREVRGGRSGEPSQHATANAIDVSGFKLEDGASVTVAEHWDEQGPRGAFLRELHESSCDIFKGVLGPDYNSLHADHFHLDLGPYSLCR